MYKYIYKPKICVHFRRKETKNKFVITKGAHCGREGAWEAVGQESITKNHLALGGGRL